MRSTIRAQNPRSSFRSGEKLRHRQGTSDRRRSALSDRARGQPQNHAHVGAHRHQQERATQCLLRCLTTFGRRGDGLRSPRPVSGAAATPFGEVEQADDTSGRPADVETMRSCGSASG